MMYRSLGQYKQAMLMEQEIHKKEVRSRFRRSIFILLAFVCFTVGSYLVISQWNTLKPPEYVGKTFYVSSTGNDKNDGLTSATAWRSIDKVNLGSYHGGDQILFEGGMTFIGTIELFAGALLETSGNRPVTISSYGKGRATINAQSGRGVYIVNAGDITVDTLNVVGSGLGCTNYNHGVYIFNFNNKKVDHIRIQNVEASGFCVGIAVVANSPSAIDDIQISDVSSHDNTEFGIEVVGFDNKNLLGSGISGLTLAHSAVFNNKGHAGVKEDIKRLTGGGIFVSGVDGAVIFNNAVFDNGGSNPCQSEDTAPSGIWVTGTNVEIHSNEAFRQQVGAGCISGGGAFQFTGTHLKLQNNYSHENDGPMILIQTEEPRKDAIVRYNVSENDSRKTKQGIVAINGQQGDVEIYNNTIFTNRTDTARGPVIALRFAGTVGDRSKPANHVHFRNNVFLTEKDATVIRVEDPVNGKDLQFQNNEYFDNNGNAHVSWGDQEYGTVAQWARSADQEKINDSLTLKITNPLLCNVGGGGTVYPKPLDTLRAYALQSVSPLIDQGVDVWGMQVSNADFRNFSIKSDLWGNGIPNGATFDIGANEYINGQTCR
jgi:hypothetical protein